MNKVNVIQKVIYQDKVERASFSKENEASVSMPGRVSRCSHT